MEGLGNEGLGIEKLTHKSERERENIVKETQEKREGTSKGRKVIPSSPMHACTV